MLQRTQHNGVSIFYRDIPNELKGELRDKLNLPMEEEILFIGDTSQRDFKEVSDRVKGSLSKTASFFRKLGTSSNAPQKESSIEKNDR